MSQFTFQPGRNTLALATFILMNAGLSLQAEAQVGIGTTSPNSSAVLDLQSSGNDKGLLIPRLTQAQRTAMTSVPDGLMVFQTDGTTGFWYCFGGSWVNIPNASTAGDNLGNHTATQNLNLQGNSLTGTSAVNMGSNVSLGDREVYFRGTNSGDANHGLGYYGGSKLWGSSNIDGPVLYGFAGGVLGTKTNNTTALSWNSNGLVGIGISSPAVRLHVAGTGGTSNVRLESLAGTGTRLVTADASGNLGSATTASLADNLGNHTATTSLNLNGNAISFGTTNQQMLNLWGAFYGIGTQDNTLYQRTASNFAWFKDGTHTNTPLDAGTGGTVQMVIEENGRLGLGTSTPTALLDVNGTSRLRGLAGTGTRLVTADASGNLSTTNLITGESTTASNGLTLSGTAVQLGGTLTQATTIAAGTNNLSITGTGNVGIGNSSPTEKLSVTGNVSVSGTTTATTFTFPSSVNDGAPVITSREVPTAQGAVNPGNQTELILFHSNDGSTNAGGPDQITLRAPQLSFQTYNNTTVNTIADANGYNERLVINPSGTVKIGALAGTGTRLVTADASGNLSSATASNGLTLSGTAFQLGGTLTQATTIANGGFNLNVTGTGSVGIGTASPSSSHRLDVSGNLRVGTSTTVGEVNTPVTGTNNMLAVAYGQMSSAGSTTYSTSGNFTLSSVATGQCRLTFTAASGLSGVNFINYPIVVTLWGSSAGMASFVGGNGTIDVYTYNSTGTLTTRDFSIAVYVP